MLSTGTRHSRETAEHAYALMREGLPLREAARRCGIGRGTIAKWWADPALYHPDIDEVAVSRALDGERAVYEILTVWERTEVYTRIAEALKAFPVGMNGVENSIIDRLARDWGVNRDALDRALARHRAGARQA